jgi:hypothetical protein
MIASTRVSPDRAVRPAPSAAAGSGRGKEPIEIGLRAQAYRDGNKFWDIVGVEFAQTPFDR